MVDGTTVDLLRRHVANGPEQNPWPARGTYRRGLCHPVLVNEVRPQLGESEIEHLRIPAGCHHDVVGLEVTMHDTSRVRSGQRFGDLDQESERALQLETPGVY